MSLLYCRRKCLLLHFINPMSKGKTTKQCLWNITITTTTLGNGIFVLIVIITRRMYKIGTLLNIIFHWLSTSSNDLTSLYVSEKKTNLVVRLLWRFTWNILFVFLFCHCLLLAACSQNVKEYSKSQPPKPGGCGFQMKEGPQEKASGPTC